MGDGVLAFFHRDQPTASCSAALRGALIAQERLHRFTMKDVELRAGIALHFGEVSYGNIGSSGRLDFTVIGPDVNLVSRIQAVCSVTGRPLLISRRFAGLLGEGANRSIGRYEPTGFLDPAPLPILADQIGR